MHFKFYVNKMLLIIQSIHLFLYIILYYKNMKFKYLIDNKKIDFFSYENFASIKNIKRKYNLHLIKRY